MAFQPVLSSKVLTTDVSLRTVPVEVVIDTLESPITSPLFNANVTYHSETEMDKHIDSTTTLPITVPLTSESDSVCGSSISWFSAQATKSVRFPALSSVKRLNSSSHTRERLGEELILGIKLGPSEGIALGLAEGVALGIKLGPSLGSELGLSEGSKEGASDGSALGSEVGTLLGESEGEELGLPEGERDGLGLGARLSVGFSDGALDG